MSTPPPLPFPPGPRPRSPENPGACDVEGAGGEATREPGPKHTLQPLLELIGSLRKKGGAQQQQHALEV